MSSDATLVTTYFYFYFCVLSVPLLPAPPATPAASWWATLQGENQWGGQTPPAAGVCWRGQEGDRRPPPPTCGRQCISVYLCNGPHLGTSSHGQEEWGSGGAFHVVSTFLSSYYMMWFNDLQSELQIWLKLATCQRSKNHRTENKQVLPVKQRKRKQQAWGPTTCTEINRVTMQIIKKFKYHIWVILCHWAPYRRISWCYSDIFIHKLKKNPWMGIKV